MPGVERDEPVEALSAAGPDESLNVRIGPWRPHRCPEHPQPEPGDRRVDLAGEDAVAVVDEEAVAVVVGDRLAELLRRPRRGRVVGDIDVEDAAAADLHGHEDVEHAEGGRHRDEEVAGHDRRGVVAHERRPALIAPAATVAPRRLVRHVAADRLRRRANAELEEQLLLNLAGGPGGVVAGHLGDARLQLIGHRRPAATARPPAPEQPEALAVPADERLRADHDQRLPPSAHQARQPGQPEPFHR